MRVLILAAGDGTRWNNYRGVPKHLVPLCGEPILHRTVRLVNECRPDADVRVVVRDLSDKRYLVPGSRRASARLDPTNGDADKFLSSRHLWDPTGRTVLLYGDCYFTVDAITAILADTPYEDGWHVFCRFDGSNVTGARGGENFAHVIDPDAHERYEASLHRIVAARHAGLWRNGGWEQYRSMCGADLMDHRNHGHATVIDDWTEDMDGPADWDEWCLRWATAGQWARPVHRGET